MEKQKGADPNTIQLEYTINEAYLSSTITDFDVGDLRCELDVLFQLFRKFNPNMSYIAQAIPVHILPVSAQAV